MKLQTSIPLGKASRPIDYQSKLLLLGSCFAEHIAEKLQYHRFHTVSNPFGILFHPLAIETLIKRSLNRLRYTEDELFYQDEAWHSFDAHSELSNVSNKETLESLNSRLELTHKRLLESTHIIISFGTAWVYRFSEWDHIVANCHKVPQKEFTKELLSVEEIVQNLNRILDLVAKANDNCSVIFTISPVRHLKDGFVENTRSKAHLISALHQVVDENKASYFPSYELVMDELRDYRFYGQDMIHPNEIAVDYIWDKFKSTWIDQQSYAVMEAVDQIQKGLRHRPLISGSALHKAFLKVLQQKINELRKSYPHMNFEGH